MEQQAIAKSTERSSSARLLLNAEAFGFGPTAAIADCFPHLRGAFSKIGFAGAGHTLDLQRRLPYDALHDITSRGPAEESDRLQPVFADYDVLLTALDFNVAEQALAAGLKVCIYDPLTWYWKALHPVVGRCDRYICQDFFGVRDRLAAEPLLARSPHVVPPLVDRPTRQIPASDRDVILLNLGGLSNPFWSKEDTLAYAELIVSAFAEVVEDCNKLVIATNSSIASALAQFNPATLTRDEMQAQLARARYALMTPGLGNIYDAARFAVPTIWLPPANDSQGQQLDLLELNGLVDGAVDWGDIIHGGGLGYGDEQSDVLKGISERVRRVSGASGTRARLSSLFVEQRAAIARGGAAKCAELLLRFGTDGARQVAEQVIECARTLNR